MGYRKASNCSAKASRGLKLCPGPPANECRSNVSFALAALKQEGGSEVATSFFLYCGLVVNATGELATPGSIGPTGPPLLNPECARMVIGLGEMGVGAEPVIGASLPALRVAFAAPAASINSLSKLVRTYKLAGISWDVEPANSTREDGQKFAKYLSALRAALAPLGARVTLYSNAFTPLISDIALLSQSIDRVLDGGTYNGGLDGQAGAGMAGWLANYGKLLVPGVNRSHVAPAMLASTLRGTWNCENNSIQQRFDRMVADGMEEIAIFTFDPTSHLTLNGAKSYTDCSNNWIPLLRKFLAADQRPPLKMDERVVGSAPRSPAAGTFRGSNNWLSFCGKVNESKLLSSAAGQAKQLLPFNYTIYGLDAGWSTCASGDCSSVAPNFTDPACCGVGHGMDEWGRPLPKPHMFPSSGPGGALGFKPIIDKVHSMGLKFQLRMERGIQIEAVQQKTKVLGTNFTADEIVDWNRSCGEFGVSGGWGGVFAGINASHPGGKAYIQSVVDMWVEWGVDAIEADDYMGGIANPETHTHDCCGYP